MTRRPDASGAHRRARRERRRGTPARRPASGARIRASVALAAILGLCPPGTRAEPAPTTPAEAGVIATEAYAYAYPLVLMELTRRVATNAGTGAPASVHGAPMNQFAHVRTLPDATVRDVPRPTVDTLDSALWFDVSREPLVITIPDAHGRYHLVEMLDMWSDVFAAPGTRTSGDGPRRYALTGPSFTGTLPADVERIVAPTNVGLIVARIQVRLAADGTPDLADGHAFQDGLAAVPLGHLGDAAYAPPPAAYDASRDMTAPAQQMLRLAVGDFFARFAELTVANPPHPNDSPMLQRLARVGFVPGRPFDPSAASPAVQAAFRGATMAAATRLFEGVKRAGIRINGWRLVLAPMGTYGTDYLRRAVVAYNGLGASVLEDVFAPSTIADAEGKPLDAANRYTLHLAADQLPPVNGFWSLTLYDEDQGLAANPEHRYALGNRDPLVKNADGSIDLYVQRSSPGGDQGHNWLPTPATGRFSLVFRLYWPKLDALDGPWAPPPVVRVSDAK